MKVRDQLLLVEEDTSSAATRLRGTGLPLLWDGELAWSSQHLQDSQGYLLQFIM